MIYDPHDVYAYWYAHLNFDVTFQHWYEVVLKQEIWRLGFQIGAW